MLAVLLRRSDDSGMMRSGTFPLSTNRRLICQEDESDADGSWREGRWNVNVW